MSKKNRHITPEEALEAAIKEYAPRWHNSPPLLMCAESDDGVPYPQPLNDVLRSGNWLIFLSSATGPSFSRTIELLSSFRARYEELGVQFALILDPAYPIFDTVPNRNGFLKFYGIGKIPVFFDEGSGIARAFQCASYPSQVLIREGEVLSVVSGMTDSSKMEAEVQALIRATNPGVPFFRSRQFSSFSVPVQSPFRVFATDESSTFPEGVKIDFIGHWSSGDRVKQTMDPEARIRVEAKTGSFYLIASTTTASMDPTRIYLTFNRGGVPAVNSGRDFHPEDDGKSSTQISYPRSYELLVSLDKSSKTVIDVAFPNARVNPVAIYGFEFS